MKTISNKTKGLIYIILGAIILSGVIVGIFDHGGYDGASFKYFTYQSNIFCAALLFVFGTFDLLKKKIKARHIFAGIVAITIFITFVVQNFFIVPFTSATYFMFYADAALHIFNPIIFIIAYYIFEANGELKYIHCLYFTIYPLLYWTICAATKFEPYFFLQISRLGTLMAIVWLLILLFAFVGVGLLMVLLDKKCFANKTAQQTENK